MRAAVGRLGARAGGRRAVLPGRRPASCAAAVTGHVDGGAGPGPDLAPPRGADRPPRRLPLLGRHRRRGLPGAGGAAGRRSSGWCWPGPAHRVAVDGAGVGVSTARAWRTPLGEVPVDVDACRDLVDAGRGRRGRRRPRAPSTASRSTCRSCCEVLGPVRVRARWSWAGAPPGRWPTRSTGSGAATTTLVVVSSDLSHYLDDAAAPGPGRAHPAGHHRGPGRRHRALRRLRLRRRSPACCWPPATTGVAPRTLALATSADASGDAEPGGRATAASGSARRRPLTEDERRLAGRPGPRRPSPTSWPRARPTRWATATCPSACGLPGATFVTLEHAGDAGGLHRLAGARAPAVARRGPQRPGRGVRRPPLPAAGRLGTSTRGGQGVGAVAARAAACARPRRAGGGPAAAGRRAVLVEAGGKRATFLPTVWDKLPDARPVRRPRCWPRPSLEPDPWPADAAGLALHDRRVLGLIAGVARRRALGPGPGDARGDGAGPGVVGLAGGGADHLVDPAERLGHLVARQRRGGSACAARRRWGRRRRDGPPAPPRSRCPSARWGGPATTASATAGWVVSTCSTSSANTFSPPVLIVAASRPSRSNEPSARSRTRSPATA